MNEKVKWYFNRDGCKAAIYKAEKKTKKGFQRH